MTDRQPSPGKEGRVKITPENGSAPYYAKIEMADDAMEPGTAYSRGTVIPASVESALGLSGDPTPADAFLKLRSLISGNTDLANSKAKITAGSYVGNGQYGIDNPNSLTFPFRPSIVFIENPNHIGSVYDINSDSNITPISAIYGQTDGMVQYRGNSGSSYTQISWADKTMSWYHEQNASCQLNSDGVTYRYVALG